MPLCAVPCLERKRRLSTKTDTVTDRQGEEPVKLGDGKVHVLMVSLSYITVCLRK